MLYCEIKKWVVVEFECVFYKCLNLFITRVGAQLGLQQMITIDIKVPNRMVGLSKLCVSGVDTCLCVCVCV